MINRSGVEFFKKPLDEIIDKDDTELFSSEVAEQIMGTDREIMDSGKTRILEEYTQYEEKKITWLSNKVPQRDHEGKVIGLIGRTRDITERKQAEKALTESESRYRKLADSISDIFYAMDNDLRLTFWNKASEKLTGIDAGEAIGKSFYELFPTSKGTKEERIYLDVLETGKVQYIEYEDRMYSKDHFFEMSVYPTTDGCSVFVKDITERKRAEEALRESEELL